MSKPNNNNDGSEQVTPVSEDNIETPVVSISSSVSIANVSISSEALSSLHLTRAIELADVNVNGQVVQQNNGYTLAMETIFIPLTQEEIDKVADYREQEAKYLKMGDLETANIFGKLAKDNSRRLLHEDVIGELLAEPVFNDDGDITITGGPLSRRKDVHYEYVVDGKKKSKLLVSKEGKLSAFIRQDLSDQCELIVANRQRRHSNDKDYGNAVKAVAFNDKAVVCDALDFVNFYTNADGNQGARVNIPFDLTDLEGIAKDTIECNGLEGLKGASTMANLLG